MRPWARAAAALGNRRRLRVHLSIRDGETNQLLGKGQADVTIEPPPQNQK